MNTDFKEISLETIADGTMPELFQVELDKVLKNIADMNTNPTAIREIKFSIKFKPDKERSHVESLISTGVKLAPQKGASTFLYLAKEKGKLTAFENNPNQMELSDNIIDMDEARKNG